MGAWASTDPTTHSAIHWSLWNATTASRLSVIIPLSSRTHPCHSTLASRLSFLVPLSSETHFLPFYHLQPFFVFHFILIYNLFSFMRGCRGDQKHWLQDHPQLIKISCAAAEVIKQNARTIMSTDQLFMRGCRGVETKHTMSCTKTSYDSNV